MTQDLPISEVRKRLPSLLKKLQKRPQETIRITVHGVVVGELCSPQAVRSTIQPGTAFLKALSQMGEPETDLSSTNVAQEHDRYLFGDSTSFRS